MNASVGVCAVICFPALTLCTQRYSAKNTLHVTDALTLTHLHSESPAAFNELANVPLTLAVAPRFLDKLRTRSR